VTVSAALPIRLKVGPLPVCCQTWAWTGPADSPGRFGVIAVAGVGKGTVSVVRAGHGAGPAAAGAHGQCEGLNCEGGGDGGGRAERDGAGAGAATATPATVAAALVRAMLLVPVGARLDDA